MDPAPCPPLHSRGSGAGDDLERRLERRLVAMADRLWKKVLESGEQVQDLQEELWRVGAEAAKASEAAAAAAHETVDKGALEARLEEMRAEARQEAEGQAAQLEKLHASMQRLMEAQANTREELQSARGASAEAAAEFLSHAASAEEQLQRLGAELQGAEGRAEAAEGRLKELQAKIDDGLDASRAGLAAAEASARSRHEELCKEVRQLQGVLDTQAADSAESGRALELRLQPIEEAIQQFHHSVEQFQHSAEQQKEGLLQKLVALDSQQQQICQEMELKLGQLQSASCALTPQLTELQERLKALDKELEWTRGGGGPAEDPASLAFPQRHRVLEERVGRLGESLAEGSREHSEACAALRQRLDLASEALLQRLELQREEDAARTAELAERQGSLARTADEILGAAGRHAEELGRERAARGAVEAEVQELCARQRDAGEELRESRGQLEAALAGAEQRLGARAGRALEEIDEVWQRSSRGEAALAARLEWLSERTQKQEAESLGAVAATEGRIEALEALRPQLAAAHRSAAACERRLRTSEAWQGACEQWQSAQEERLSAQANSLQWLADQCKEVQRQVDAKVAEVRRAAKEDLAASALNAFQGELKLWGKLAQMNGQPVLPQGLVQAAEAGPAPCRDGGHPGYVLPAGVARTVPPPGYVTGVPEGCGVRW